MFYSSQKHSIVNGGNVHKIDTSGGSYIHYHDMNKVKMKLRQATQ
jgi:hypothetical protein